MSNAQRIARRSALSIAFAVAWLSTCCAAGEPPGNAAGERLVDQLSSGETVTKNGTTATLHRKNAGIRDASGWYAASSTLGHFTMRFRGPFNDATFVTKDKGGLTFTTHNLFSRAPDGLMVAVVCIERSDRKIPPDSVAGAVEEFARISKPFHSQPFTRGDIKGIEYRGIWANGDHYAGQMFITAEALCQIMAGFPDMPLEPIPDSVRQTLDSFRKTQ